LGNKRVGIFGGTFDPPHLGHLLLAESIREEFALDEVLFIPSNQPPHKERDDLTATTHRYAMVVAATLQNPAFTPSAVEVNRPGRSYSIETVRMLEEQLGPQSEMFFVAGLDSFLDIETWKSFEELLDLCHFIVVSRPGSSFDAVQGALPERFLERLVDVRTGHDGSVPPVVGSTAGGPGAPWKIFLSDAVYLDVSATEIRARVRATRSICYRVTPEVEHYIRTHGLYRPVAPAEGVAT